MFEMKRACVYTRVSTDKQAEKEISLIEQERMGRAAIESKGWQYIKTYKDDGFTGSNMNRPALKEMISDIESGKVNAVFIYKLDRLSRSQRDTLTIIEDIMLKNSVELISLHETLDTSTPWGRAMIGILSSFNQLERENIKQRTSDGRNAKARMGGYAGGKPPIGYMVVDGKLVIVPKEAEIVRLVFELRAKGETLIGIKDRLNELGYRTKKGNLFQHSAVQTILNNEETYRGRYKYGNSENYGLYEPILK